MEVAGDGTVADREDSGTSRSQGSKRFAHLVWNRQPDGGRLGLGISPASGSRISPRESGEGMALTRASV